MQVQQVQSIFAAAILNPYRSRQSGNPCDSEKRFFQASCVHLFIIGLQPSTNTRAELDSSTVLKQIFYAYEYHPLRILT